MATIKHKIGKQELLDKLNERLYESIYLHWGVEREVATREWKKNGNDRTYIKVRCYKLTGKGAGIYDCGYYDNLTGEYVVNRGDYDAIEDWRD